MVRRTVFLVGNARHPRLMAADLHVSPRSPVATAAIASAPNSNYPELRNTVNTASGAVKRGEAKPYPSAARQRPCPSREDDIHVELSEIGREAGQPLGPSV